MDTSCCFHTFVIYCRHSVNYVLSIMELKLYKYTKLHGLSKTNQDFRFVSFCLVNWLHLLFVLLKFVDCSDNSWNNVYVVPQILQGITTQLT